MVDWFMEHWDEYVGVSFLKRNNPLATAEELGFKYLPQECVSRERYEAYRRRLSPIDISEDKSAELLDQAERALADDPARAGGADGDRSGPAGRPRGVDLLLVGAPRSGKRLGQRSGAVLGPAA